MWHAWGRLDHRALEATSQPSSFFPLFFAIRLGVSSRVLAALRGLSVGLIAFLLGLRGLFMQYVATGAGLASHRVRLWQGGPASILTSSSGSS